MYRFNNAKSALDPLTTQFKYNKCIGSICLRIMEIRTWLDLNTTNVSVQYSINTAVCLKYINLNTTNVSVQSHGR